MPFKNGSPEHNGERDRIANQWHTLMPFVCAGCGEIQSMPKVAATETEIRYKGLLRADVVALDSQGNLIGTVEVVRSHTPSLKVLKAQEQMMQFAYYRVLPKKDRKPAWICSPKCWQWYSEERDPENDRIDDFDDPACDGCKRKFSNNSLTPYQFEQDVNGDPHSIYCANCVIQHGILHRWQRPPTQTAPWEGEPTEGHEIIVAFVNAKASANEWNLRKQKQGQQSTNEPTQHTAVANLMIATQHFDKQKYARASHTLDQILIFEKQADSQIQYTNDTCQDLENIWEKIANHYQEKLPS